MRKNIYTFLAMIAMGTAVAGAEVLLEENFDYPQGEFPLEESGWYTQWGEASSLSIGEGLTFDGYACSGVGNGVVIDADDSNNPHRAFKQVTEGNVYVAFMLRPSTAYKKGYFLTLRDEKVNDYYSFNFNGRVSVNESGQLGLTFANNQNAVYADEVLDGNTTYLVVLKYTIVEGKNNDNVSLYCFDKMPDAEPANSACRSAVRCRQGGHQSSQHCVARLCRCGLCGTDARRYPSGDNMGRSSWQTGFSRNGEGRRRVGCRIERRIATDCRQGGRLHGLYPRRSSGRTLRSGCRNNFRSTAARTVRR